MIINLKQIRALDPDNIKLDKINYNFDQLVVNSGGPKGYAGPDGNIGPQGFQGALGVQGDRGDRGAQGPSAVDTTSYWVSTIENGAFMSTLFGKHIPDLPEYSPVIASGYIDGDIKYNQQQQNNGLPRYQWVINRRSDKVASNLRLTSEDVVENAFDITMDNSDGLSKLYLSFINIVDSQLNLQAKNHIIKSAVSGNDLFSIGTGSINTYNDTSFEKPVTFNASLSISIDSPDVDKIVTSNDNTGSVTFKTSSELGGSVKIGTIISILPSIFGDLFKFVNYQTIDSNLDLNNPIKIRMGAGIGDYEGWYVCNGQTWTNGSTSITVPELNSFSYQITSNPNSADPNSQGYINVVNNEVSLIGGANISVSASIPPGSTSAVYNNSLTNNSNDPQILTNASSAQFKIKKLPQIIYLETIDLWWSQLGDGQLILQDYSSSDYEVTDYNAG